MSLQTNFFLTLGTDEERGIKKWRNQKSNNSADLSGLEIYDFPFVQERFNQIRLFRYIPFCPSFMKSNSDPEKVDDNYDVGNDNKARIGRKHAGLDNATNDSSNLTIDTQL
jgi:hypothetical protein